VRTRECPAVSGGVARPWRGCPRALRRTGREGLLASIKSYYEDYWDRPGDVSEEDPTTPERRARLIETLRRYLAPGAAVLDLGCGAGRFTRWIREAGYQAAGADIAEGALRKAREAAPGCEFLTLGEDGRIPAEDGRFRAVWTTEVIEHVVDVGSFLQEIRRVLADDGLLILTTPHHGPVKNILVAFLAFDTHFDPLGAHIRFFSPRSLGRCLAESGFALLSWNGIGRVWPVPRTMFAVARKAAQ
jgi:SAM-dependent methyltransferase